MKIAFWGVVYLVFMYFLAWLEDYITIERPLRKIKKEGN